MTNIKYNGTLMSNSLRRLVQDADNQVNRTCSICNSTKAPYGFQNSSDISNTLNVLRTSHNTLQNYLKWIDNVKKNFDSVNNDSLADIRAIDKQKVPLTDKVVKKQ